MIRQSLLALLGVQLLALALTLWGSFGIAVGLNPESLQTLDALAPLVSLLCVAWWMSRAYGERVGWSVAFANTGFWLLMHIFVATRFLPEFWREGLSQLSPSYLFWWSLAIMAALAGARLGARFPSKKLALFLLPLALLGACASQALTRRDHAVHFEPDGTSWRLLTFDLKSVDFGLYDADSDDSQPNDNRNTTWLVQALPRVWSKSPNEPLCVVNGGFFGASAPLVGEHEAPLRINGRSLYDVDTLQSDWPLQNATLVWRNEGGVTQPQILRGASFSDLQNFSGALGGVRVLLENSHAELLKPGMGGTTLKCCRTSIAWNRRTNQFWVLSVRDPDGEASSVRDNQIEKRTKRRVQVGGWDVAQVQQFWRARGATDAVLFDGGESGQIAYRDEAARWRWVHSSYHISRTPFFWHDKPLRAVLPMLPPTLANGGVLNWFIIKSKTRG